MKVGGYSEPTGRWKHQSDEQNNLDKLGNWNTYIMECRNAEQDLITKVFQKSVTCEIGPGSGFENEPQKYSW